MSKLSKVIILSSSYFALLNSQAGASPLVEELTSNHSPLPFHASTHYSQVESSGELELSASYLQTTLTTPMLEGILKKNGHLNTSIDISENNLGDDALKVIAAYPHFKQLYLQENCFTDEGAVHLKAFRNAQEINLSRNRFTNKGMEFLPLDMLETLQVDSMGLGNDALKIISKAPRLQHLNIRNAQLDDESSIDLLELQTVEVLGLSYNNFTDKSLPLFAQMKHLKVLDISYNKNKFSEEAIEQLRRLLPGTKVVANFE